MDTVGRNDWGVGVLAGAVLVVAGSLLPWMTGQGVGTGAAYSRPGIEGDGIITLMLGLALSVSGLALLAGWSRLWWVTLALGAGSVGVGVLDLVSVEGSAVDLSTDGLVIRTGVGLWVTILGGVVAVVSSIAARRA